jgi:hypothetical protein
VRINKKNVVVQAVRDRNPASYAEAVMAQNPDIEAMLEKLCQELVGCDITKNEKGIVEAIVKRLEKTAEEQKQSGYKKKFRRVAFEEPPPPATEEID